MQIVNTYGQPIREKTLSAALMIPLSTGGRTTAVPTTLATPTVFEAPGSRSLAVPLVNSTSSREATPLTSAPSSSSTVYPTFLLGSNSTLGSF